MTEYELNELLLTTADKFSGIVEFWVSISFAVVVACFFISGKVNRKVLKLMGFLYVLSSLFLATLYVAFAIRANHYYELMVSSGYEVAHFSNPASLTTLVLVSILFIGGTFSTVYYMYSCINGGSIRHDAT